MKKAVFLCLSLFFCLVLTFSANAEESAEKEASRYADTDSLFRAAPEGTDRDEVTGAAESMSAGKVFSFLWERVFEMLTLHIGEALALLSRLGFFLLGGALWRQIRDAFSQRALTGVFDILLYALVATECYAAMGGVLEWTKAALNGMTSFSAASSGVIAAFGVLTGKVQTAAAQNAGILFGISLAEMLMTRFFFPLLKTLFALTLTFAVSDLHFESPVLFLSSAVKKGTVFLFTVLSAVLTFQTSLAKASDGVLMRAVRFAAGAFIPVVGNLVGESAKTLAAEIGLASTKCGVTAALLLLLTVLPPVLRLLMKKIAFSLARWIAEILREEKMAKLMKNLSGLLDLMLALCISCAVFFLFAILLSMRHFSA